MSPTSNAPGKGGGAAFTQALRNFIGNIRKAVLIVLGIIVLMMSFYTVEPEEAGVVMRFGRYDRTTDPGLHAKIPFIETVEIVPVERQLKQEFGYRTTRADVQSVFSKSGYVDESLMLTGDLNLADVEWVVQYRVADPYLFLFKVRDPESTLRDMSEASMRQIVGDRTVNEVLTIGRAEIALQAQTLLQQLCDEYETGIRVEQVVLQDINPPDPVKPSFNSVNEAQQERETLVNQALSEYNRVIPRARGEALQTIQQAEGYAIDRVNRAQGDVAAFNQLHSEYVKAPQITKRRIYYETLQEILPKIGNKVVTDEDGASVLPLLQMQLQGQGGRPAGSTPGSTPASNRNPS